MTIVPLKRPQMTKAEVLALVAEKYPNFKIPDIFWVGMRGYYKKTMGDPDQNDRAMYDDAIFLVAKDEFVSYNANCDPSRFVKNVANLKAGVWSVYRFDKHRGAYIALCQRAGKVTVIRDGVGEDTGMFGINIHRGGFSNTGSEGCQTIVPAQWDDFITYGMKIARKYDMQNWANKAYTYVLIDL